MNCSREREKKLEATKTLYKVNRANPKRDNMVKICPINPSFSRVAGCNIHDLHLRNAVWYIWSLGAQRLRT